MNTRLLDYLRSLGLDSDAADTDAWDFYSGLRGIQRSIANSLNYTEQDYQARTNCDLMIRSLGYNPEKPSELLDIEAGDDGASGQRSTPGTDGASLAGDLEEARRLAREEGQQLEQQRTAEIREYAEIAGSPDELVRTLVEDASITAETARSRILEDHRQRTRSNVSPDMPNAGPGIHSRNSQTGFDRDSLSAALMLRQGINDPTRVWARHDPELGEVRLGNVESNSEIMRSIDRGDQLRHLSMVEIARRCLALDGINCEPHHRSIISAMQHRGAAMGTANLVGSFTQVFGAVFLQAFLEAPDTTSGWVIERENPNFFQNERTRMGKMGALTKHGRGKTADSVDYDDNTEFTKLSRYSGMFTIDEIDLINDTFGALNDFTPAEMGAAARRIRPDLVYAILLSNPNMRDGNPLFDLATHKNVVTGALTKANLQAALTLIATQQERGVNLNLAGRHVISSQTKRFDAREMLGSATVVIAGNTDTVRPTNNALSAEDLQLTSDARIDNGLVDPNSGVAVAGDANDWFVAAPASQHTIEVTYLAGSSRSPEIRSKVLDGGQWGIGWDVKHDIGASALSWEGLVYGNG